MLEYNKILVPVDFSEISRLSIRKAMSCRNSHVGQLILIHVVDYAPPPYVASDLPAAYSSEQPIIERARKHLIGLSDELNAGSTEIVVRSGQAKIELVNYVQEQDIDLVVMAAHSNSALEKLLGSTTSSVVQKVDCDVLVIHG